MFAADLQKVFDGRVGGTGFAADDADGGGGVGNGDVAGGFGEQALNGQGSERDAHARANEADDTGPLAGLLRDGRREAGAAADGHHFVVERWADVAGEEDEWMGAELGKAEWALGEVVGDDGDEWVGPGEVGVDVGVFVATADEAEVGGASGDGLEDGAGGHFVKAEFDAGVFAVEGADDFGEIAEHEGRGGSDGELAYFTVGGAADGLEGQVGFGEDGAGAIAQEFAGRGKAGGAGGAFEQAAVEAGFENLNVSGKGWLGDVEAEGGAAKVEFFGDGEEVAEMAEFDPGQIHTKKVSIYAIDSI